MNGNYNGNKNNGDSNGRVNGNKNVGKINGNKNGNFNMGENNGSNNGNFNSKDAPQKFKNIVKFDRLNNDDESEYH